MSSTHDADGHGHFSRRGYLTGFLLSAVLTAIPFWLVMTGAVQDKLAAVLIVIGLAVIQILVHTLCFLHLNTRSEGGWTLMAYIFTAVIVLIVITGSLWIMYHISGNMMPALAGGFGS
jgi:cytochrome o ubiquinol oxidase operon protein cyoD